MTIALDIDEREFNKWKIEIVIFMKTLITQRSTLEKFCKFIDKKFVWTNILRGFQNIVLTIDCGNNDREFLVELLRAYSNSFHQRINLNDSNVKIVLL